MPLFPFIAMGLWFHSVSLVRRVLVDFVMMLELGSFRRISQENSVVSFFFFWRWWWCSMRIGDDDDDRWWWSWNDKLLMMIMVMIIEWWWRSPWFWCFLREFFLLAWGTKAVQVPMLPWRWKASLHTWKLQTSSLLWCQLLRLKGKWINCIFVLC